MLDRIREIFKPFAPYLNQEPKAVRIDASTVCQLKCPSCPTGLGVLDKTVYGVGHLSFDNFKNFVDENPNIKSIELSNQGELFLNPAILKILEYAFDNGVSLTATNGANFNTVKPEVLEGLVKYQFKIITLSIDGASQETYKQYRIRGNFDNVLSNVTKLCELKRKHNSYHPVLNWQFVLFGHNVHEIEKAREICRELDINFFTKPSWDSSLSPLTNTTKGNKKKPIQSFIPKRILHKYLSVKRNWDSSYCRQVWRNPQVNWDGKLLGCCKNTTTSFGNVFSDGFVEAKNSADYTHLKRVLLGKEIADERVPCLHCESYIVRLFPIYLPKLICLKIARKLSLIAK